ncbi:MAG: hypothetical protein AAF862_14380 [Pseudomonadota bacterium]
MCTVSMIGDHYNNIWKERYKFYPNRIPDNVTVPVKHVSQYEFDQLKRQVEEMKLLLERAIKYDEENDEPHCETEEKMELLRKMAALVGVDLDEVIGAAGQ